MTNISELNNRIEELEMKLMFQDELVEKLSQSLIRHHDDIRKLTQLIEKMSHQMQDIQHANVIDANLETPPPHY